MDARAHQPISSEAVRISLYCSQEQDGNWRVFADPNWLPPFLRPFFDAEYEACALQLDFDDLERFMSAHEAPYDKRVTRLGAVELDAQGRSAGTLATWLAGAFGSGFRPSSH